MLMFITVFSKIMIKSFIPSLLTYFLNSKNIVSLELPIFNRRSVSQIELTQIMLKFIILPEVYFEFYLS